MKRTRRPRPPVTMLSGFTGFRCPREVILLAVRWYLRYGLSYRDLEELLAERGIEVDHVTLYRWVQRFTPLLIDAARPCRHVAGDRWFVDETYVKVSGVWRYVYRAVDQRGQVIDVHVSQRRDIASARTFFTPALSVHGVPTEVITDRAPALANVVDDLVPAALHNTGQYENNRVECDHGRLKARLRAMRGLKTDRTASIVIRGHAFVQNLRRGHYERAVDTAPLFRLSTAFGELIPAVLSAQGSRSRLGLPRDQATQQSLPDRVVGVSEVRALGQVRGGQLGLGVGVVGGVVDRGRPHPRQPIPPSTGTRRAHPTCVTAPKKQRGANFSDAGLAETASS